MAKQVGKRIEAIRAELKRPIPEPLTTKESSKMAAKKGSKKISKKAGAKKKGAAKRSAKNSGDLVSLASLAEEAGISGQAARAKLRTAGVEREDGKRWGWTPKSKALSAARKALGL